jgi:hypothetical protein
MVNTTDPKLVSAAFGMTRDAVTARQAKVNDAAPPVHGPSQTSPALDPQPAPPPWWTGALLDL